MGKTAPSTPCRVAVPALPLGGFPWGQVLAFWKVFLLHEGTQGNSQVFAAKILCLPQGAGQGRGGGVGCAVRYGRATSLSHTPLARRAWTSDFPLFSLSLSSSGKAHSPAFQVHFDGSGRYHP